VEQTACVTCNRSIYCQLIVAGMLAPDIGYCEM